MQKAGIEIQTGLLADQAERLNIGFVTPNAPWLSMGAGSKIAASFDRTAR
ncbi:MAG: hypothetical protein P0107_03355 [Nitrosomonas sp.]|nr:hypothetical protein [Nitrosomonas sp.]